MKHIVILCDGMADYPVEQLNGKTPMSVAKKPHMEHLAKNGCVGLVKTVAEGLKPGSDVANLSVLGYDPKLYYAGRSPLEAASIGIDLKQTDVTLRCNLVTLSDEPNYEEKTILDYCGGDISTEEAEELIEELEDQLGCEEFHFYSGVSYRHCVVWNHGTTDLGTVTPPHDIIGKKIKEYLPSHSNAAKLLDLMRKSCEILENHPVNKKRIAKGLAPANAIWLWGEGYKKPLPSFQEKYGLNGVMISAVDLLKGIGILTKMKVVDVPGATGYIDTNFDGKAEAAIEELLDGKEFAYVHVEAPDECGHRAEIDNKIRAIELIDEKIVGPIIQAMQEHNLDYKVMVLPDHATPICKRTHTSDPVPFLFYSSAREYESDIPCFDEENAKETGVFVAEGDTILEKFIAY